MSELLNGRLRVISVSILQVVLDNALNDISHKIMLNMLNNSCSNTNSFVIGILTCAALFFSRARCSGSA